MAGILCFAARAMIWFRSFQNIASGKTTSALAPSATAVSNPARI
jgi:hypothetical protein